MKNLSVSIIKNSPEYRPYKSLHFSEILVFVFENIRLWNFYTLIYFSMNIAMLAVLTGISIHGFSSRLMSFGSFLSDLGWGALAGSILIIPVHEGLHALGFLLIGARKIRFGADLSQMIFYATAEDFVAGRKGFTLVALAPVAFINAVLMPLAFMVHNTSLELVLISLLLFHNAMCIGDFAMLSFFIRNRDRELYTFDEIENRTAWFYEKIKE